MLHKTTKKAFDELGLKKLPTIKSLQAEYAVLLAENKKEHGREWDSAMLFYKRRQVRSHRILSDVYVYNTGGLGNLPNKLQ